ncbi:MAG: lipid-A-disaccharide synthase [Candidatus Omnitrophica bacterium]|nr:lipid-A-disaccharide synthase [Candidatus Omnitrophota bacterium]
MADKKIMIVAGEASGDMHAAHLIKALRELEPSAQFSGLGGERMEQAGARVYYDLTRIAVVGFQEVLRNLGKFRGAFKLFLKEARAIRPDCVVLVDYPGFNLALAKQLKRLKIRTVYYISPQVWAWHRGRVKAIRKFVDKMLVVFRFEKEFYEEEGIEAEYVGHPLLDIVRPSMNKEEAFTRLCLSFKRITVALLPGSRQQEVKKLLPVMLEAAKLINKTIPPTQFVILRSEAVAKEIFEGAISRSGLRVSLLEGNTYDGINIADFCIVASGTATLEVAIMERPMVVVYKTSLLTSFIARCLVRIPDIALVNVVAGGRIVPELIQSDATAQKIAKESVGILSDPERIISIRRQLQEIKEMLKPYGAAQRAAKIIVDFIHP